jgi:mutator protein MutT
VISHSLAKPRLIVLAAAIFDINGRVLLARKRSGTSNAGLWEFPGGKLESGETAADCLRREIMEELGLVIRVDAWFATGYTTTPRHQIELRGYHAYWRGEGSLHLNDHDLVVWVIPSAIPTYPLPEADLPLAAALQ